MIKIVVTFSVDDNSWVSALSRVRQIFASLCLPYGVDIVSIKDAGDIK